MSKWTRCGEQMPADRQSVLLADAQGHMWLVDVFLDDSESPFWTFHGRLVPWSGDSLWHPIPALPEGYVTTHALEAA